jgi:hypothetical protein
MRCSRSRTTVLVLSAALALIGVVAAPARAAAPLHISKSFQASSIPVGGTTKLSFAISNTNMPGGAGVTGIGFNDSMPPGLVVATPSNLDNTCDPGTATAVPGSSSVSLSGATLGASVVCVLSVDVAGASAGDWTNSVTVTSTVSGTGNTAMASLTVIAPPTLGASFGAASIPLGGSTSLSFTVRNPNGTASLSGVGFSDTLPGGLTVATPNGATGSCDGGTIAAAPGASTLTLSGATLAPGASCTFSVNVTATGAGVQNNITGPPGSSEGGTGSAASTTLTVVNVPPPAPTCPGTVASTPAGGGAVAVTLACSGPAGVALNYAIVSGPAHGSLGAINQTNGQVTYTSQPGFVGTDRFTYRASDAGGSSNTATATITVPATKVPAKVTPLFRLFHSYTTVFSLIVTGVPRGATVQLTCKGRGCAFKRIRKTYKSGAKRLAFTSRFKHGKLRKGTVIEVRVTAPGKIGLVARYTIRPPAFPRVTKLCLPPGARKPVRC